MSDHDSFRPVRSLFRSAAKLLSFCLPLVLVQPTMILQASIQIQTRFRPEHRARSRAMRVLLNLLTALVRCTLAFFRSRNGQAIIELALRQQLATYALEKTRPRLTPLDRAFWVALLRLWPHWRDTLVIVKPATVIRWHRKGFRLY